VFCVLLVLVGWTVSKVTGSRAFSIETWAFEPGETVLWKDERADVFLIPQRAQAVFVTDARFHRFTVVATDRRALVATRASFTRQRMVLYVLTPTRPAAGQSDGLGGGLLTVGYRALVYRPEAVERHASDSKPYLELPLARDVASSTNLAAVRVFTDDVNAARLPGTERREAQPQRMP
jgi:hypothetical protein